MHSCSPVDRAVPSGLVALLETLLDGKSIFFRTEEQECVYQ